ncbi:MAG TPA: hypothetical protein VNF29_06105 [Candidatus Binataceae bacterium]|nr:hypothetical protein [Candidatus Binataceae bacterium]
MRETDRDDYAEQRRALKLFALFAGELIALSILWLPITLDFSHFAFCDNGAILTTLYLAEHGYRVGIDFGYHYGLLPILVARIWYSLFSAAPVASQLLSIVGECIIAFALARIAVALKFGPVAVALIAATIWIGVRADYPAIAHLAEAVLLCTALALQSAGRRRGALAFACAAIFAKPSMGYLYSLWLLAFELRRSGYGISVRSLSRMLMPAAATAATAGTVLAIAYGPRELVRTIFPIEGAIAYHALHYGFFTGSGRGFWALPGSSWEFYLFSVAGFWLAATVYLAAAAFRAARELWQAAPDDHSAQLRRSEIVLTCFVLHAAFVCLFFGNQWSWIYYSYFLIVGIAAASEAGPTMARLGFALGIASMLSLSVVTVDLVGHWKTEKPIASAAHLWALPADATEWAHVLQLTTGHRTAILDTKGAAELMYPQFEPPVSLYLDRGLMRRSEVHRKVAEIDSSELIVVPIGIATCGGIPDAPALVSAMRRFAPIFQGRYFDVYRLREPFPAPVGAGNDSLQPH